MTAKEYQSAISNELNMSAVNTLIVSLAKMSEERDTLKAKVEELQKAMDAPAPVKTE